jgi:TolB protein
VGFKTITEYVMKKIFVVFTILLGLLAACAPAATPAPIPATKTLVSPTNTPIPATATLVPTVSVTATQPLGDNGTGLIAFLSDRDGKPAIYVMNADGSNQRRLAGGKPRDTCLSPVWSPDGQRIAYMVVPNGLSGDRHGPLEIWSVGLDGAAPIELSVGITDTLLAYPWNDPIWSPDGTRLAVAAFHPVAGTSDKRSVLTILRSDGSGVEQAFPLDWISGAVEWSPNGEQILIQDISLDESVRAHNVHVLSLSNGEIREVYRDLLSAAWSPDGTEIVVVPDQSEQVLIVKLDGASRPIGPLPAGITPERAVWSPDGIALAVFGTTNNREEAGLYLVTVSTGQVRSIALAAKYLHGLAYSPDGKQVLISMIQAGWSSHSSRWPKSTLWVYDLASDTLTALTDGKGYDAAGTWAPVPPAPSAPAASVGGEIAFASDLDGDFEIWLTLAPHASAGVNADGSNLRQLTDNAAMDISPAWSPDGARLAFISNRDGNDELYTMNADGSDVRRLTETPDASESFPAWSPDGQFISFDSDRGGNWDVYIVGSDGSNLRRLIEHPGEDWISSWSPDGQKIAFESKRDGNYEIYVVNIDGSNLQRLTQNTVQDGAPKWSPDGSKIAFFSRRDGNSEIYVVNADGSNPLRLTNRTSDDSFPAWSPDGDWLVFSSGNNQQAEIYLIAADGSQLQALTANGAQNWTPAWRPAP